jgi:hypothetical protein
MLKIGDQLSRSLRYQAMVAGQFPLSEVSPSGPRMGLRRDPETGSLVGFFAADEPKESGADGKSEPETAS